MESAGGVMISDDPSDALQELMQGYGQDVWHFAFLITKKKEGG
ncbi:hypothetical protein [Paenibacillus dendrobii]|nr:hypothetical protein [Paenibacillus dendrobii]